MPNAEVTLRLQSQVAPQIAQTANAYKTLSAEEQKAEQAATRYAKALTQVALADAKTATEEQRLAVQTANAARAQIQAEGAALRLANAQSKAASGSSFASQTASAFKGQILSMVGPLAVATAALGTLKAGLDLAEEGFKLKAGLDSTRAAIDQQISSFRNSGQVFREGQVFADRYKITQAELSSTLQASIPILRNSSSSTTDLLNTISLLQATTPEKPISEAARALRELATGDVTTIKELFNVSAKDALTMKNAIAAGGDPVQVLAQYLKDSGASMTLLDQRTQGATGKMNELAVETEKFTLALGGASGGPGLALLNARLDLTRGSTRLLSGDFTTFGKSITSSVADGQSGLLSFFNVLQPFAQLVQRLPGYQQLGTQATVQGTGAYDAQIAAIRGNIGASQLYGGVLSAETQKKLDSQIVTAQLAQEQAQLDADSRRAAAGLLGAGDQALVLAQKYGIAVDQAQFLINAQQRLSNATALADQRVGERDPSNTRTAAEFNKFDKLADAGRAAKATADKAAADKAAAESKRLQDAQDNLALARARTTAQKIAELKRQQAATADPVEKLQLQAQIEQAQQTTAKARTSELGKQLNLQESIYDSMAKQRDAALDLEELAIRDRQQDRADQAKIRAANAILADPRKARLHDAARDSLALIDVQDRQRAAAIADKSTTAGAQLINGKLFQSVPGGALPPSGRPLPVGALPSPTGAPISAQASGVPGVQVFVTLDGAQIAANVTTRLTSGLDRHAAGGGA